MTQLESARKGIITPQMQAAAEREQMPVEQLREKIALGEVVLPCNVNHKNITPIAVGKGLSTKVNANIGTSDAFPHVNVELLKLATAV
ncbi:MAG: phosphomethylpyrimidine synthase ThiC, partial [Bacillota bacterium]|nr:phosphomethylpyrimidine synthase ThiC [Bacillota bacterium]